MGPTWSVSVSLSLLDVHHDAGALGRVGSVHYRSAVYDRGVIRYSSGGRGLIIKK